MALGSTPPLTEMSVRNISWGVKVAGAEGWHYYLHVQCLEIWKSQRPGPTRPLLPCTEISLSLPVIILLTPCDRVLEKLTDVQLVKKFPEFYGSRKFITALTSARQLSLFWASSIQSIPPHPTSWRSILILSFHLRLGLPIGLFPSGFPTKTLYTPLLFPIPATCPAHLIFLDLMTRTILSEEYGS